MSEEEISKSLRGLEYKINAIGLMVAALFWVELWPVVTKLF